MFRLPLFPLGVVLFPGVVMPLHIFEPRYRQMVARCLEGDRRFGLVYHDPDQMGPFLLEEGRVGCVAEIQEFQPLPDGRSLILVGGVTRFRIMDGIEAGNLYFEGLVEELPDEDGSGDFGLAERRRRSVGLFQAVVEILPEPPERLPELDVGEEISFRLAPTIRIDPAWQQALLETRDERDRLDRLDRIFQAVLDQGEG